MWFKRFKICRELKFCRPKLLITKDASRLLLSLFQVHWKWWGQIWATCGRSRSTWGGSAGRPATTGVCRNECWRTKEPPDRDRKRTAQTKSWLSWSEGRVGAQCRARSKSQSAEHKRAERRAQSRAQSTKLNTEPRTEYRARKRWWPPNASRTSVENGWEATTVLGKNREIVASVPCENPISENCRIRSERRGVKQEENEPRASLRTHLGWLVCELKNFA